ncbi:HAL/PAL/TAL family ammonia-lyase [Umboniibacter marinipuniceus]|uniref:tyrosine ammonia-lyase n=1 Tax=Umboniibacter marinipuniceus TaxID=569599 RepID=A0A3M0AC28_9GAMM|nr:aromatic amino acid ammonia-lyase [Umboniibacter marinipuniceus]RMA82480.1 histidine ammonia-lyase [Umboniibacter marinipuniceus]
MYSKYLDQAAEKSTIVVGRTALTAEDIVAIAHNQVRVELDTSVEYREWIDRGTALLDQLLEKEGVIYGVTTGYGDSCTVTVSKSLAYELPRQIYTFHGCGMGAVFSEVESRAILAARLVSLARGYSGVSWDLLAQLVAFLNNGISPRIPEEGSVGASGDLTPLSYVAASLCGEREVFFEGQLMAASEALSACNLTPLSLRPKEGLALMNGTAVMTALACLNLERARYAQFLATRITALNTIALDGNDFHYDERLFNVKAHLGQNAVARQLREDLEAKSAPTHSSRLQDRYSLRCAPHVIGVLADALSHYEQLIETELNSSNDNPIIDPETQSVLHGGHFYGGHIAHAMDSLKTNLANIADLLDRQLAQAVDVKFNHGLPSNLSGAEGDRAVINHGLKAVQIGVSSWTAEALKLTMPASVFSRSTECHNQDKVSMGTIAARDCRRVLQLLDQVCAAVLFGAAQGVSLRNRAKDLPAAVARTLDQVFAIAPPLSDDRALELDLRNLVDAIVQSRFH